MNINPEYLKIPPKDLIRKSRVPLTIVLDKDELYENFAQSVAAEIIHNNKVGKPTRLILPVGPIGQYPILVNISNQERISWKNVFIFNMDEYCDWQGRAINSDHPLSFKGYMFRTLVEGLDPELRIPSDQLHFPDPLNLDRISKRILDVGGIDTCYGGIGYHGHIAFNEPVISRWYQVTPDEYLNSMTRLVQLEPETIVMNSIRTTGGDPSRLPPMAVTLGLADIYASRRIRLYCQGGIWQRTVLRIALLADEDVRYPVTLLSEHPDYEIFTTQETALPPEISQNA